MKPTEILLDLSDQKLGRIIKKDFEEVIVEISAVSVSPTPFPIIKRDKAVETKGAETLPIKGVETYAPTVPIKAVETRKAVESAVK